MAAGAVYGSPRGADGHSDDHTTPPPQRATCPGWTVIAAGIVLIAACCGGVGALSWRAAVDSDTAQARLAFDASVMQQTTALQTYVDTQLRVGQTLAAAVAMYGDTPSHEQWLKVLQPHAGLLLGGGAGIVRRINNTDAGWQAFADTVMQRDGVDVSPYRALVRSQADADVLVADQSNYRSHIGIEFGRTFGGLDAIQSLTSDAPQLHTGVQQATSTVPATVAVYTSVFPDDDATLLCVLSIADITVQVQSAAAATDARVVVTDTSGGSLAVSSCADGNVGELSATSTLRMAGDTVWAVEVTACASMVSQFHTNRRWEVLAATLVVAAVLLAGLVASAAAAHRVTAAHRKAAQLEAAEAAHGTLVGHLAHELRNPLHVLRSWFPVLLGGDGGGGTAATSPSHADLQPDERAAAVADVQAALHLMSSTVNDVLDFQRLSAGKFTATLEACSLQDAVSATVTRCAAYIPDGIGVRLAWWGWGGNGSDVTAEVAAVRLSQVMTNGMSNAGKAGLVAGSSVVVRAGVVDGRWLAFDVANTGTGLPADTASLFIPFQSRGAGVGAWKGTQAPPEHVAAARMAWQQLLRGCRARAVPEHDMVPADRRRVRGATHHSTGLGLPLSRAFAKSCGGWLGLEDDASGRTHFWGVFPVAMAAQVPPPSTGCTPTRLPAASRRPNSSKVQPTLAAGTPLTPARKADTDAVDWTTLRVAVVDDEAPNRRVLQRLLTRLGVPRHNLRLYTDGATAEVALGEAWADVMLLDNSMPDRTGVETVLAARRAGAWDTSSKPVVVAATGSVDDRAVASYRQAGMAGVLYKPFTRVGVHKAVAAARSGDGGFFRVLDGKVVV